MKHWTLVLLIGLVLIMGCATGRGGISVYTQEWYRSDRSKWQTNLELLDCKKRGGSDLLFNYDIVEECMVKKGFAKK